MNRTDLRAATAALAERARTSFGQPSVADIADAQELFAYRTESLTNLLSSSVTVKYCEEPDWTSWQAIVEFFDKYHAALVEIDNKSAGGMAAIRLQGI
jgi:hypothetical protein